MSHFSVLVPAMDEVELDGMLLPFYEYGCSEEYDRLVEPYLEFVCTHRMENFVDDAHEIIEKVSDRPELKAKYEAMLASCNVTGIFKAWEGGCLASSGNWGYWHNPNAKWDWYAIGGRWSKQVLGDNDSPLVGEVDFEYLRGKLELEGEEGWLNYLEEYGFGFAFFYRWVGWLYRTVFPFAVKVGQGQRLKRVFWGVAKRLAGDKTTPDWSHGVEAGESRRAYLERGSGALTWALITKGGEWLQQAEMGWFGMSRDYQGKKYFERFWEEVLSWPPEQRVYVVDCHI